MSANPAAPVVVAYCRAGFEPEAAADLTRLLEEAGRAGRVEATTGDGYVTASLDAFDLRRWSRAFERCPPVFVRGSFVGTGPHAIASTAEGGPPDRVTPIVDAIAALPQRASAGAWVEFPDTNEGKALSTLARALAPRVQPTASVEAIPERPSAPASSECSHPAPATASRCRPRPQKCP